MRYIKKKRVLLKLAMCLCVFYSGACNKETNDTVSTEEVEEEKKEIQVKIQVGTRTIETKSFTSEGTPVVPMWQNRMGTADLRNGAGFPILNDAEHTDVWLPSTREDGAYNHYACLIHHKGKFYAMWGNHESGEDAPGQRVLYATSETWGEWTDAKELFPAPGPVLPRGQSGIHLKPDRWVVVDDKLYAVTYVHGPRIYPIARAVHEDGTFGDSFLLRSLPYHATIPVFMEDLDNPRSAPEISEKIIGWYADNAQVSWWAKSGEGIPGRGIDDANLIESFTYRAADGGQVLMSRYWGTLSNPVHNNRIYVSFNNSTGAWGTPYPSDIPDSPTRGEAISLDNGTVLLIGSQTVPYYDQGLYLDRDPITVSVSKDGYVFDKVFALRTNSPRGFRFSGVGGRNPGYAYSSSIVHEGFLYTLYSIGKEDMGISRVPLSAMGL